MKSYLFGANSPYSHGGDICECSVHMSWPEDSILFMLTRTRNKSNDKMFFFFSFLLVIIRLYPVGVVFGGISMLANALLLWSYDSRNPYLAFPYLIWNIFMLLYTFGLTIFLVVIWNGIQYHFVVYTLYWLLSIYLIIVVYSYIQTLREDPSAFDIVIDPNVVVMQPAPYAKFP